MNRTLLLIPVFALFLIACREKHATTTATPPAPDPNAYNNVPPPQVITTENDASEEVVTGNSGVNNQNTTDTVVTTVVMPDVNTGNNNTPSGNTTVPAVIDSSKLCRLVVSFISKGGGIDYTTQKQFEQWLAKDERGGFTYTKNPWGREGEVNYCFNLDAKSRADQTAFVNDVRKFLDGKDRVIVCEWAACEKGNVASTNEPANMDTVAVDSNIVRLVVSFISKGQGTDGKTKEEFEKWLNERPQFFYEKSSWGREGEVNYCFRMTNIDGRQQEVFIRDVRTFMTGKDLVIVSEWEKCDKRK